MHRLDGPRAKVTRAWSQLVALQEASQRFFKTNPNTVIVPEFDKKAGHYPIRIKSCPTSLPEEWSIIIGEIVHDLRSALDLLAWQLALLDTPVPNNKTGFPIYDIGHTQRRWANGQPVPQFWHDGWGLRQLRSIHERYWARIEAFQPYKEGHGYLHHPLFLLRKLNDTDKHRLITILFPSVSSHQISGFFGGGSRIKIGVPIRPNAKIGWIKPLSFPVPTLAVEDGHSRIRMQEEVQVKFDISSGIRFGNGCNAVKGLPIFRTFKNIHDEVSRIIESFVMDF